LSGKQLDGRKIAGKENSFPATSLPSFPISKGELGVGNGKGDKDREIAGKEA